MQIEAQSSLLFQKLNVSNGLSYNDVNSICVDKKGNLWVATGRGLNMFNGKTVEKYYAEEFPELQNNISVSVHCDADNRIWVLSAGGNVTMIDEKRQFHRVGLYEKDTFLKTRWILNGPDERIILHTYKGLYSYAYGKKAMQDSITIEHFKPLRIPNFDTLQGKKFQQVFQYDNDAALYIQAKQFYKINFRSLQIEKKIAMEGIFPLIKWGKNELLCCHRETNEISCLDLESLHIRYPFKNQKDQFGNAINAYFYSAAQIDSTKYIFTTLDNGIYLYDIHAQKFYNHKHDHANPSSISGNAQTSAVVGLKGWIFVTGNPSGINYFNPGDIIGNQQVFNDGKGKGYDNRIYGIASQDNNTYYIGTSEGWLEWKRNTNTTTFIKAHEKKEIPPFKKDGIGSIIIDQQGKIWGASLSNGIYVIDKNLRLLKHISNDSLVANHIKHKAISELVLSPSGDIWVSGSNGICKINSQTYQVDNVIDSTFSSFNGKLTNSIRFSDKDNIWFTAWRIGAYHIHLPSAKVIKYSTDNGLMSNGIWDINFDFTGNTYFSTIDGLNIVTKEGKIKSLKQKDGLLIDRTEALLSDSHNRMWIGNDVGLACYDPKDSSIYTFDERYGLTIYGFLVGHYYKMPNGEFFLATPKGIQYFHPDSLFNKKIELNVLINKIQTNSFSSNINESTSFRLSPSDNQVSFSFTSVDFTPHVRTYYQYQLVGIDKEWIKTTDQNSVTYNLLPSGTYNFKVRISNDGKHWQDAENQVLIEIAAPFYKRWWFILASIAFLIPGIIILYRIDRKQQLEKRSSLETELVITYFASQINSHKNVDQLLWDICKNCISRLHFEDCVIYLVDESNQVLIQKAAYGPKDANSNSIQNPLQIPIGKGITGTVAISGKPEIINDTRLDDRYIRDDDERLSEIAVPIFMDKKVVGVIDSEHRKKHFFTIRHQQILSTIAILCANQMQKIKADEDKQRTTMELLENKQKATESRLQSLRLQMNPHFLFNALNSIQQMILANEEMVATTYLSRFSKLLRAILIHSDRELITLKEEIEIIKMYVELESVRFKDLFKYSIYYDEEIETEEIKIPTLLIQPFVENAIWHGLMHKEGNRLLTIAFNETEEFLQCIIEDNGVGRKQAKITKSTSGKDKNHNSKGISVSEERLKTIKNSNGKSGSIEIIDLEDSEGKSLGTRVIIHFPI